MDTFHPYFSFIYLSYFILEFCGYLNIKTLQKLIVTEAIEFRNFVTYIKYYRLKLICLVTGNFVSLYAKKKNNCKSIFILFLNLEILFFLHIIEFSTVRELKMFIRK